MFPAFLPPVLNTCSMQKQMEKAWGFLQSDLWHRCYGAQLGSKHRAIFTIKSLATDKFEKQDRFQLRDKSYH